MRKKTGVLLLGITVIFLMAAGCGNKVSNKSPESVVKSLIQSYHNQDQKAVKKCFGIAEDKDCGEEIQKEIDYHMNCFKARNAKKVSFEKAKSICEAEGYKLVYAWYNYEVKDSKLKVPSISFYYVKEKDEKYYVVPAKDVTQKMSEASRKEYNEFVQTDEYKKYEDAYKEFIEENPKYEENLEDSFKNLL